MSEGLFSEGDLVLVSRKGVLLASGTVTRHEEDDNGNSFAKLEERLLMRVTEAHDPAFKVGTTASFSRQEGLSLWTKKRGPSSLKIVKAGSP